MWKNVEMWNHHIQDPIAISSHGFLTYFKNFYTKQQKLVIGPPPPPQGANLYCDGI